MSGANSVCLGRWGEALAARWIRERGYTVIASGYHTRFGEIDLIATNDKYLCFIEVKLRKSDLYGTGRAGVTITKQRKLRITAEIYLSEHPTDLQPRFDVAEIYAPYGTATERPALTYLENAF